MTQEAYSDLRRLGSTGPTIFPFALGCMGMSGMYGRADDAESTATIHAALDRGIMLLDTEDLYGTGHNELLSIAWVLAKSTGIVPVVGARTRAQRGESLGALDVRRSPEELVRIEGAGPASAVAGARYDDHQMRALDSER